MAGCWVCGGQGDYPIYGEGGRRWGMIRCPECGGTGMTEEEEHLQRQAERDRARYDAAMQTMRFTPCPPSTMDEMKEKG